MRTWADIRFESLAANLSALRRRMPPGARLLLPVKANAYGHGAVMISRWAEELGVEWLGVAAPEEGLELRAAGVQARILLFGPLPGDELHVLREQRITPTLCSLDEAARWADMARGAPAHVEIDTGMGRVGFDWRDPELDTLARVPGLVLEAAYTHFPAAEAEAAFTREQDARFRGVLRRLADGGLRFSMVHLANSAALLHDFDIAAEAARPGIAAYGVAGATAAPPAVTRELQPVLEWWARVVQVRRFAPWDTVGYGRTARISRTTRAAVLAVGYGDGYPLSQSDGGAVDVGGTRCPLLGRISMDLTLVDSTDAGDVRVGDPALLLGAAPGLTADDLAARSRTISYEILTGIRRRVVRRYHRGSEPVAAGPHARSRGNPSARESR